MLVEFDLVSIPGVADWYRGLNDRYIRDDQGRFARNPGRLTIRRRIKKSRKAKADRFMIRHNQAVQRADEAVKALQEAGRVPKRRPTSVLEFIASLSAAGAPKGRYGRSTSLKWPWLYDKLRSKGYDKSKAAAISNSRVGTRKKGRLNVLKADQAHNPTVLKKVAAADKAGKHVTGKQLTASARRHNVIVVPDWIAFACQSKACAPPPVGTGGSSRRLGPGTRSVVGLRNPDGGFTITPKGRSIKTGIAVALSNSETFIKASDAFDAKGKPTPALAKAYADHLIKLRDSGITKVPGARTAVGAWHNPADGLIEFNTTAVFPAQRRDRAVEFGRKQNQISILDLGSFEFIDTGGDGGDRQAA